MLRRLQSKESVRHPRLLTGIGTSDDAGVFQIGESTALVQTVDFFTPIVDEPYDWGRIAAANSLSDVYAMGGTPVTALAVAGWPRDKLPFELLEAVMDGGADVLAEAACTLVGGHTVDAPEPIFGYSVTGIVDPDRLVTNAGARDGDDLVLTKAIGTGIVATAIKQRRAKPAHRDAAVAEMVRLNREAAAAMADAGVSAATDVTGFGLLGHLLEMLRASGRSAIVDAAAVPVLPGTREYLAAGAVPGGTRRNVEAVAPHVTGSISDDELTLLADAQTSGGLLIATEDGPGLVGTLGTPAAVIGRIEAGAPHIVIGAV